MSARRAQARLLGTQIYPYSPPIPSAIQGRVRAVRLAEPAPNRAAVRRG